MSTIDVHETQAFRAEYDTLGQMAITIGMLLVGVLFVVLFQNDPEGFVLGLLVILGVIIRIARAFYLRSNPRKPFIELSSSGILYRHRPDAEFLIPWNEIHGLELDDISLGGQMAKLRNVILASVSKDFFDANAPADTGSMSDRRRWEYFIPKGDMVRIAIRHDLVSVPPEELWTEIETRWRMLSGDPDTPVLPVPRVPKKRRWFG